MKAKMFGAAVAAALSMSVHADYDAYEINADMSGTVVDWTSDSSYVGNSAPENPSNAKVVVKVPVKVDSTTFAGFAAIKYVRLETNGSVEIDTGDAAEPFALAGAVEGPGTLVVRGTGTLQLTSRDRVSPDSSATNNKDYNVNVDVQGGTLEMFAVDNASSGDYYFTLRNLNLAESATNIIPKNTAIWLNKLTGKGTMVSPTGSSDTKTRIMPQYKSTSYPAFDFEGAVYGSARLYTCANMNLLSTNSTMAGTPIIYGHKASADYAVGVVRIGRTRQPSSLGKNVDGTIYLQQDGGHLRYLGEGEDTDKNITVYHSSATSDNVKGKIDGGLNGGLVLSGTIGTSTSSKLMQGLELAGAHTNACVISGPVTAVVHTTGAYTNRMHFVKTGSGTWRFRHNASREGVSAVTVRDGTLAFDTLADLGEKCAFGTGLQFGSPVFYPDVCEQFNPAHVIPYQFKLGDASTNTVGTFALGCATGCVCATRPVVVDGVGCLSNGFASARMAIAGISSVGSGQKTLVLDGVSSEDNTVMDVSNGVDGVLSVVKRGPGKWIIGGEQTFSGALRVEGGELVVRPRPANAPFSWFRIVLKENWGELPYCNLCDAWANSVFSFSACALYDAAGNNRATKCRTVCADYTRLGTNEVAYCDIERRDLDFKVNGQRVSTARALSLYPGSEAGTTGMWLGGIKRPYLNNPDTHVKIDARLPEGGNEIVAIDFSATYGFDDSFSTNWTDQHAQGKKKWNFGSNIKVFNAYGSADGVHWEPLFDADVYTVSNKWVADSWYYGANYSAGAAKGLKFDHVASSLPAAAALPNVGSVSVSGGALLRAEGAAPEIDCLEIDAASGGTISNFVIAASGTLVVRNVPDGVADVTLPGVYQDVSGFDAIAASWELDAGSKSRNYTIVSRNGELHLVKKGLMLIYR